MVRIDLKNRTFSLMYVSLILFLFSCKGEDIYYQQFEKIPNSAWEIESPVSHEFKVTDTNSIYDFFFNLRNTNDYAYSNLYIFWELKSPDGRVKTDTSQFILAKPNGQWLGKTISGTIIENSMVFFRKKLPVLGTYMITFTHGMREEKLEGIKDVGLKIKKNNE